MTYTELFEKAAKGEISLPVEVTIKVPVWDEFELDTGCRALLTRVQKTGDDDELRLFFDFENFVEYNKAFWAQDWFDQDGRATLRYDETPGFSSFCDCFVMGSDEVKFSIGKSETETKIEELEKRVAFLSNLCIRAVVEGWTESQVMQELAK